MDYYLHKILKDSSFEQAIENVTVELKKEGFGVLTEIDVKKTLKEKINVDFKKYKILGACNPHYAYKALQAEDKIGVFLPCNVVVEERDGGDIEISIIDPNSMMSAINNKSMDSFGKEVQEKFNRILENLS